jgi:hypothetical protein
MMSLFLEPVSPNRDDYSFSAVSIPDEKRIVIEIVGPGFDASDLLRSDLGAHERWELDATDELWHLEKPTKHMLHRSFLIDEEKYRVLVQERLAKIAARSANPAFPGDVLRHREEGLTALVQDGRDYLRGKRELKLLKHEFHYIPIQERKLVIFTQGILRLLSGLARYGIHLGASSVAASYVTPSRLVFWDFFPARRQESQALYPRA